MDPFRWGTAAAGVALLAGLPPAPAATFGEVLGLTPEDATLGARVTAVAAGSQAEEAGLAAGDTIVQVAGRYVNSAWDLMASLDGLGPDLRLHVRREGQEARDVVLRRPRLAGDIAFRSSRSGVWELWRVAADGSSLRQLTTGNRNPGGPAWSPDGQWVAFEWQTPYWDIWVVDRNGNNLRRLTSHPDAETRPRWSADGRFVYFISYEWGGTAIGRVDIETLQRAPVAGMAGDAGAAPWRYPIYGLSPDGRRLAYPLQTPQGWKLHLARADGANPVPLVEPGEQIALNWSADGRRLLWFWPSFEGGPSYFVRDMDTGAVRHFQLSSAAGAVWAPDGESVIHDTAALAGGASDLYVADLDGRPLHRLTYHPAPDDEPDWWAPR